MIGLEGNFVNFCLYPVKSSHSAAGVPVAQWVKGWPTDLVDRV